MNGFVQYIGYELNHWMKENPQVMLALVLLYYFIYCIICIHAYYYNKPQRDITSATWDYIAQVEISYFSP